MIREAQRLGFPIRTGDQTMGHKGGEIMSRGGGCLSRKSELKITRATVFLVSSSSSYFELE